MSPRDSAPEQEACGLRLAGAVPNGPPSGRANAAVRVARWWTRCYTAALPGDVRDARRAEVESDLWESMADGGAARHILARLALGILDDLTWSMTRMDTSTRAATGWSLGTLATFALAWLWLSLAPDSVTMRESLWAFPAALVIHLLGLVLLVGMRLAIDLRMTGWAFGGVPASQMVGRATPWSVVGAVVAIASGMALYAADSGRMATNPVFQVKVAALALALANMLALPRRPRPPACGTGTRQRRRQPPSRCRPTCRWRCGPSSWSPASSFRFSRSADFSGEPLLAERAAAVMRRRAP